MQGKHWIAIGAASAAVAIALGAIGAHAVEGWLSKAFEPEIAAKRLSTWQTAAAYHRFHALGLVLVGLMCERFAGKRLFAAGVLMLAGTILFSGLLYAYAMSGAAWMGPIFPIGGLCYITSWIMLAASCWKRTGAAL